MPAAPLALRMTCFGRRIIASLQSNTKNERFGERESADLRHHADVDRLNPAAEVAVHPGGRPKAQSEKFSVGIDIGRARARSACAFAVPKWLCFLEEAKPYRLVGFKVLNANSRQPHLRQRVEPIVNRQTKPVRQSKRQRNSVGPRLIVLSEGTAHFHRTSANSSRQFVRVPISSTPGERFLRRGKRKAVHRKRPGGRAAGRTEPAMKGGQVAGAAVVSVATNGLPCSGRSAWPRPAVRSVPATAP